MVVVVVTMALCNQEADGKMPTRLQLDTLPHTCHTAKISPLLTDTYHQQQQQNKLFAETGH